MALFRLLLHKYLILPLATTLMLMFIPLLIKVDYIIHILIQIFMYCALAISWDVFSGLTGYVNFALSGLFGAGGYAFAIFLKKTGMNPFLALLFAVFFVGIVCLGIGSITLRLAGVYFVVTTFAITVLFESLVIAARDLTGGSTGISIMEWYILDKSIYYYHFLGVLLFTALLSYHIRRSKFGLGLVAIRENELAAQTFGVNVTLYKVMAFTISGLLIGYIGGLNAWYVCHLDPEKVFSVTLTTYTIASCVLGGIGTFAGPIIGASVLTLSTQLLVTIMPYLDLLVQGSLLVFLIAFAPRGVAGIVERYYKER